MTRLSVNLNKIALLRNARDIGLPSVIDSAKTVINAGAYGITVHPRPDERHIKYDDVFELNKLLAGYPDIEFNIEGNPFTGRYMEIMEKVRPDQATLVPDSPDANTSDHGWEIEGCREKLTDVIRKIKNMGIRVSLFMDPSPEEIAKTGSLGADRIELYTEPFAAAFKSGKALKEVTEKYIKSAESAGKLKLAINAGHDLNLENLEYFCSNVPDIKEVSIGHALVADAIDMGLDKTVKKYLEILKRTGDL